MLQSQQQLSHHFKTMASFMSPVLVFPSPPSATPAPSSSSPLPVPPLFQNVEKTVKSAPSTTLAHLQESGCKALHKAIASEQTKSWLKLFETYYHLAVAYQNLNLHKKATEQLTFAAETAAIPKNGCEVGCNSETFYHTPIFSRRAFSHVMCDKKKEAIKDANKAVNLDSLNPDVYCIRALVWNSYEETKKAIYDLNKGLKLNPYHVCALIIRGAIINSLNSKPENEENNKDHEKAYKICQKSILFFDVTNFKSPKMAEFYEKFLWSLNVPHTVTSLNLLKGYSTFFTNLSNQKISPKLRKFPGMPFILSSQRTTNNHLKKSLTESSNSSISHLNTHQWLWNSMQSRLDPLWFCVKRKDLKYAFSRNFEK
ncbi:uncharacterized protein LOC141493044 isoform X2 [Macrotis lagotis]|uniref:uncharacterized protein LOC141493044 isoform X2 n=1 Tax=Macrotis lagotis TaxID=92651 RepID=UPI003D68EDAC